MKVLTAAEMRQVDRRTIELGIAELVLMENAGHRVVEALVERFAPLEAHRIVILCGKGNNGGDGLVIARQLYMRFRPLRLDVVLAEDRPPGFDALVATGCPVQREITPEMRAATIVVDALLGTGLSGPPREPYLSLITEINHGFAGAQIVAVDLPSGMASDAGETAWPHVRAHLTVTFTAPKLCHVLEPNATRCGRLIVAPIGSPDAIIPGSRIVSAAGHFAHLFGPRHPVAHKGDFGHVLVVGGASGKSGAAAMAGLAALRAGAGLVTVCSADRPAAVELMWEPLGDLPAVLTAAENKSVLAVGPGLGPSQFIHPLVEAVSVPIVLDADALNAVVAKPLPPGRNYILTPHPGEMARLSGCRTSEVQARRLEIALDYAARHQVTLVLKGRNTLVAFPDGQLWINPTGGPAMATAGSGDILTGLVAGLVAQFPADWRAAVVAAVWLHGRSGDLAAGELGEKCVIATDLLRFLPRAMAECSPRA